MSSAKERASVILVYTVSSFYRCDHEDVRYSCCSLSHCDPTSVRQKTCSCTDTERSCCYIYTYASLFRQKQAAMKQTTKNKDKYTTRESTIIPAATLRIQIAISII